MMDYNELMKDFIDVEEKMTSVNTLLKALEEHYYADYQPEQHALVKVMLWLQEEMRQDLAEAITAAEQVLIEI